MPKIIYDDGCCSGLFKDLQRAYTNLQNIIDQFNACRNAALEKYKKEFQDLDRRYNRNGNNTVNGTIDEVLSDINYWLEYWDIKERQRNDMDACADATGAGGLSYTLTLDELVALDFAYNMCRLANLCAPNGWQDMPPGTPGIRPINDPSDPRRSPRTE